MSIVLIVIIVTVVLIGGLKLRRGTFFRWSSKKGAPTALADRRDGDDRL